MTKPVVPGVDAVVAVVLPVVQILSRAVQAKGCALLAAVDQLGAAVREAQEWEEMCRTYGSGNDDE
jgi:hypothetical protein